MTLILKPFLDMVKISHHTKNEVSVSRHSKDITQTDRQTHRQYENITFQQTRAVTIITLLNENVNIYSITNATGAVLHIKCLYDTAHGAPNMPLAINSFQNSLPYSSLFILNYFFTANNRDFA